MKGLDDSGRGSISDVIAAIDYAILMKDIWNIRVINLSIATGVYESYDDDPLTLADRFPLDAPPTPASSSSPHPATTAAVRTAAFSTAASPRPAMRRGC